MADDDTLGFHPDGFEQIEMTSTTARVAARAIGVTKAYGSGETRVLALDEVSVAFDAGRFTAIMGPSGSGKSTLMHCLAGLDTVSGGEVYIGDTRVTGLSDRKLTRLRRDKVGFIFQQFNLLPTLTAQENILLPLSIARRRPDWTLQVIPGIGHVPMMEDPSGVVEAVAGWLEGQGFLEGPLSAFG